MKFYSICYYSSFEKWLSKLDIENILSHALHQNEMKDINGILLANNNKFFQIIEGEYKVVRKLFDIIRRDTRHRDIKLVFSTETEFPIFKTYSCNFNIIRTSENFQHIETSFNRYNIKDYKSEVLRLLEPFYLSSF